MSERIYRYINRPYGYDQALNLRYGENSQNALIPFEPISDKSLCLGIIGNTNLLARHLEIKNQDRSVVKVSHLETGETKEFGRPGKSAFIIFEPSLCARDLIREIVPVIFENRNPTRQDRLHCANVQKIEDAGWLGIYVPLQLKKIINHVRLVSKRTFLTGEDPSQSDIESLRTVFEVIQGVHG